MGHCRRAADLVADGDRRRVGGEVESEAGAVAAALRRGRADARSCGRSRRSNPGSAPSDILPGEGRSRLSVLLPQEQLR